MQLYQRINTHCNPVERVDYLESGSVVKQVSFLSGIARLEEIVVISYA